MKKLNSLFYALSLSALFLVSCGNENEPTNPGDGGTVPPVHTDSSKLVTSIVEKGYMWEDFYDFTYNSDNRLIRIDNNNTELDIVTKISYSPFSYTVNYDDGDYCESREVKFNEDGDITYSKFYTSYWGDMERTCEYKEGYLMKSVEKSKETFEEFIYTWEDGNLIKMKRNYDSDKSGPITSVTYYTYSEKSPVNTGVYFPNWDYDEDFMLIQGVLGKTTAKIPDSVYDGNEDGPFEISKRDIRVEYDSKGRIIKYFENEELKRVYAYEGNKAVWPEN